MTAVADGNSINLNSKLFDWQGLSDFRNDDQPISLHPWWKKQHICNSAVSHIVMFPAYVNTTYTKLNRATSSPITSDNHNLRSSSLQLLWGDDAEPGPETRNFKFHCGDILPKINQFTCGWSFQKGILIRVFLQWPVHTVLILKPLLF